MAGKPKTKQITAQLKNHYAKDEILGLVADGYSLERIGNEASAKLGVPVSKYYVCKLLQSYGQDYADAKKAAGQIHAEKLGELADKVETGLIDPASARVSSDNRRWLASKLDPSQYGEKIQADIKVYDMNKEHLDALKSLMVRARVIDQPALEHESEDAELIETRESATDTDS